MINALLEHQNCHRKSLCKYLLNCISNSRLVKCGYLAKGKSKSNNNIVVTRDLANYLSIIERSIRTAPPFSSRFIFKVFNIYRWGIATKRLRKAREATSVITIITRYVQLSVLIVIIMITIIIRSNGGIIIIIIVGGPSLPEWVAFKKKKAAARDYNFPNNS